jgi:hypothetical protein
VADASEYGLVGPQHSENWVVITHTLLFIQAQLTYFKSHVLLQECRMGSLFTMRLHFKHKFSKWKSFEAIPEANFFSQEHPLVQGTDEDPRARLFLE